MKNNFSMEKDFSLFFKFNDLSDEAQTAAMYNLEAEEEYWDKVEEEADNYIKDQLGRDINFDWHYDGENITICLDGYTPDEAHKIEKAFEDIENDAIEILDGNNNAIDNARFTEDGVFVGFI